MVDNIEYTINHGLSYETANYLQNMGDGRLLPVPVRAIALDFPRFAIMHDHAATGDRIEYNGLEYQIVGPVRRYLGWAIFQVKQAMARGAAWVPNFTPGGAPRARDIVQRAGGVVLLDAPGNSIGPGVTFSRADQAMVCDEQGNWTWTALPYRRSFDVSTQEWGYLFEPERTNLFKKSETLSVVEHAVQGLTFSVVSRTRAGDFDKVLIHISGTATGDTAQTAVTDLAVLAPGAKYTLSIYARLVDSGPAHANKGVVYLNAQFRGGAGGAEVTEKALDGHVVVTSVASDHTGALFWLFGQNGKYYDHVVELWAPQVEEGQLATSPITTNGAVKTVAADVCTFPTTGIAEILAKRDGIKACGPATSVSIPTHSKVQFLATFPSQLDDATRQLMLSVVQ